MGAGLAEGFVSARVIAVIVCIDEKRDIVVGHRLDGGHDLVGKRRELIVDQKGAVRADGEPHIAPGAGQHIDAVRHFARLDVDL